MKLFMIGSLEIILVVFDSFVDKHSKFLVDKGLDLYEQFYV